MTTLRSQKLLPHEWVFGAFILIQWLRLCAAAGPLDRNALFYFALLVTNLFVVGWCLWRESQLHWMVRLWFYPLAVSLVYFTMHSSVLKVAPHLFDGVLAAIDRSLFGATLSVRAQAIDNPVLTEVLSFCYLLYFPYMVFSWVYYTYRGLPLFQMLAVGLFTIHGIGYLGYAFVPAAGPHLAAPDQFAVPLAGWAITKFNAFVVASGSNGVDVFPSLHCAVSSFLLFFDRQHSRWRFWFYLVPCVGLWMATIYLRYHYFTDVVCGFMLSAFALWLVNQWEKTSAPDEAGLVLEENRIIDN